MQDVQQTDVSSASGMITESDDECDTIVRTGESSSRVLDVSNVPQSLGLSINLSFLSSTPNSTTTTTAPPQSTDPTTALPQSTDPFRQPVGPTHILPSTATPKDFFGQVFTDDLLRHIVDQTNLYVRQNPPSSSRYKWFDISVEELKAFIGVRIVMGLNV